MLRGHSPDAALAAMCALLLRDEAGHVAFRRDRLADAGRSTLGLSGALWQLQFRLCVHAAGKVLWACHGPCLPAIGGSRREYFREVKRELRGFFLSLYRVIDRMNHRSSLLPRTNPAMFAVTETKAA